MTKKHYEAIAKELLFYNAGRDKQVIERIANSFADYFEQDNPRFDRSRFLEACGIDTKSQT